MYFVGEMRLSDEYYKETAKPEAKIDPFEISEAKWFNIEMLHSLLGRKDKLSFFNNKLIQIILEKLKSYEQHSKKYKTSKFKKISLKCIFNIFNIIKQNLKFLNFQY